MHKRILMILEEELEHTTANSKNKDIFPIIDKASRVFVAGAGRSLLVAKMFAMRLVHLDYEAYVIGETNTPSINEDDLLLIISGSGNTDQLIGFAGKARHVGAKILLITSNRKSNLAIIADSVVSIGYSKRMSENILPLGSRFELSTLIYLENVVLQIMKSKNITQEEMQLRHANLE